MYKITQEVEKLPENFTGIAVNVKRDKEWYLNGKLHRKDGPAVERATGTKHWYLNGKLHREDGPACEYSSGDKAWYLNDKYFAYQEEWKKALDKSKATCNNKIVEIDGKKYKLVLTEE